MLQARIALAQEDSALGTFYLKRVLDSGFDRLAGSEKQEVYRLLADLSYESADFLGAYGHYLAAVNMSAMPIDAELWLRLAEIAFYHRADMEAARIFLLNYRAARSAEQPGSQNSRLVQRLSKRLRWNELTPESFGLNDANISALQVDGDDLWIGTWNGGICRYSIGQRKSTVFQSGGESLIPKTVRSIEITPSRVWIGTYQGLYQYTKSNSHWQRVSHFGEKVEALCSAGGSLYVGTLGQGLWRSGDRGWEKVGWAGLPGEFINCLVVSGDYLLIGTLNLGLVILELKSGRIFSFDSINPDLSARNVITLLVEDENTLWIGTYGEGLYRWKRQENRVEHFSKSAGQLTDDWILCAVQTDTGLYFGTFGGGISRLGPQDSSWQSIGLRQGLSALDISTVTYSPPFLFFGTLGSGVSVLDESLVLEGS